MTPAAAGFRFPGYNPAMPASLSSRERARLKSRAHALEPVVQVGHGGLSETVAAELDRALTAHELIKVRIADADRETRAALCETIADRVGAAPVQRVGKIVVLWRPNPDGLGPMSARSAGPAPATRRSEP